MRKSSSIGLLLGFGLILGAVLFGTGWSKFLDPASLLVVLGGTAAAVTVSRPFGRLKVFLSEIPVLFSFSPPNAQRYVDQLSNFSRIARREGMLALDRRLDEVDNELLRFGLELMVDGSDEDELRKLLSQRISERRQRRNLVPELFMLAGTYSPAFGMVGTLIGLIQMLQNLEDPSQIGAGMATALVTTFYGAVLANLVFLPLSNRAETQNRALEKIERIILEGTLSIAKGDSPRMIERRIGYLVREDELPDEKETTAEDTQTDQAGAEVDAEPAAAAA